MEAFSSNQVKILITVVIIITATLLLGFLVINPLLGKVKNIQLGIEENEANLAKTLAQIDNFKNAEIKLARVSGSVPELVAIFPLREDAVSIIQAFEDAVAQAGLAARLAITDDKEDQPAGALEPPPLVPNLQKIEEVGYMLRLSGEYRNLVDLFLYLENLPFITEVTKLSLTAELASAQSSGTALKTGEFNGELSGTFFLRKL